MTLGLADLERMDAEIQASGGAGAVVDTALRQSPKTLDFRRLAQQKAPPRPKQTGPGSAPALCGPTCSMPPVVMRARLPPPAPIVWMSIIGMRSGIA